MMFMNSPTYAEDLRFRQGIIPDLLLDVTSIDLPENVAKMLGDCTLADMKTLAPGTVYSEPASTTPSHAVEKRQKQVSPAYHASECLWHRGANWIKANIP